MVRSRGQHRKGQPSQGSVHAATPTSTGAAVAAAAAGGPARGDDAPGRRPPSGHASGRTTQQPMDMADDSSGEESQEEVRCAGGSPVCVAPASGMQAWGVAGMEAHAEALRTAVRMSYKLTRTWMCERCGV